MNKSIWEKEQFTLLFVEHFDLFFIVWKCLSHECQAEHTLNFVVQMYFQNRQQTSNMSKDL